MTVVSYRSRFVHALTEYLKMVIAAINRSGNTMATAGIKRHGFE